MLPTRSAIHVAADEGELTSPGVVRQAGPPSSCRRFPLSGNSSDAGTDERTIYRISVSVDWRRMEA